MKGVVYCADVIARYGSKYVVVERLSSLPGLAFPGGKQERFADDVPERLSVTVVREFREETGLELAVTGVLGTYAEPGRDPRGEYVSTVFIGIASGIVSDEEGKTEVRLLDEEEMLDSEFIIDHGKMLRDYLASQ